MTRPHVLLTLQLTQGARTLENQCPKPAQDVSGTWDCLFLLVFVTILPKNKDLAPRVSPRNPAKHGIVMSRGKLCTMAIARPPRPQTASDPTFWRGPLCLLPRLWSARCEKSKKVETLFDFLNFGKSITFLACPRTSSL